MVCLLQMERLAFNPLYRRFQDERDTANNECHHKPCRGCLGIFLGSIAGSNHFSSILYILSHS
jgi:hypothetical protein